MLKPETFGSNQQFINAWSYFTSTCPKGEILAANELVITWSGTDNVFINAVFLTKPVYDEAELEAKIKVACDYAKKRNQPWWMVVAEDWGYQSSFVLRSMKCLLDRGLFPYSGSLVWILSNCFLRQHIARN